jgi:hypothetical protein
MDWGHWRIVDGEPAAARQAAVFAALAGAFSGSPEGRLVGAMWNAGLDGQRGFDRWQYRRSQQTPEPLRPEPYRGLRQQLFGAFDRKMADTPFVRYLSSPARLFGELTLEANLSDGRLFGSWTAADSRLAGFATSIPSTWTSRLNLTSVGSMPRGKFFDLSFAAEAAGKCEAWIDVDGTVDFPPVTALPRYDSTPVKLNRG